MFNRHRFQMYNLHKVVMCYVFLTLKTFQGSFFYQKVALCLFLAER
jgi:hypothetical protein